MPSSEKRTSPSFRIARRRPRCVRFAPNKHERRRPLTAAHNNEARALPSAWLQTDRLPQDDDLLMRTMYFPDEDLWATYAAELHEALGERREPSGRLRKLRRFSTLVVDLALRKARSCARKLSKDAGPLA
ncbi:hypothetical protein K525DRAFT_201067 [Schizophyllum commune Loenen D]|nr:hypothetical protein K525DRAFT_201067 [Schizophyllum commune Loenen D]